MNDQQDPENPNPATEQPTGIFERTTAPTAGANFPAPSEQPPSLAKAEALDAEAAKAEAAKAEADALVKHLSRCWSLWLAGVGPKVAADCTDAEHRKLGAIGNTILVPTILGGFSAAYATSTLNSNPYCIAAVGIGWAFMILTIDRALVATVRESQTLWIKIVQFIVRILVAGLMAITISHPLTLLVFDQTIEKEVFRQREDELKDAAARGLVKLNKEIASKEDRIAKIQAELQTPPTAIPDSVSIYSSEISERRNRLKTMEEGLKITTTDRVTREADLGSKGREQGAEYAGVLESGKSGKGPQWRKLERERLDIETDVKNLKAKEAGLEKDIRRERDEVAKIEELDRTKKLEAAEEANQTRKRQHGRLEEEQKTLQTEVNELKRKIDGVEADTKAAIEEIPQRNANPDILAKTMVLHRLFEDRKRGGDFTRYAFIALFLLFIGIDIMPVLTKFFTKRGEYDERIDFHHKVAELSSRQKVAERFPLSGHPTTHPTNQYSPVPDNRSSASGIAETPIYKPAAKEDGPTIQNPILRWMRERCSGFRNVKRQVLSIGLGAVLLTNPQVLRLPYADESAHDYLDESRNKALAAYGICRIANAAISVAKESEVSIGIFGTGVQVAAGQVLDPVDELVERTSDLLLTALTSLVIQKLVYEFSVWISPALCGVALLGAGLFGFLHWEHSKSASRFFVMALFMILLIRCVVPVSALLGERLDAAYFEQQLDQHSIAVLPPITLDELRDLDRVKDYCSALIKNMEVFTDNLISTSAIMLTKFVVEVILFPLGFFWCFATYGNRFLGWNLSPVLRHREIAERFQKNPASEGDPIVSPPQP